MKTSLDNIAKKKLFICGKFFRRQYSGGNVVTNKVNRKKAWQKKDWRKRNKGHDKSIEK